MRKIALIDMDNTLCNLHEAVIKIYPEYDYNILNSSHELNYQKSTYDFWYNLEPIPSGLYLIEHFRKKNYEIHIATKGPHKYPMAWAAKKAWIDDHVGLVEGFHLTTHKHLLVGDVLVDDWPNYGLEWIQRNPTKLVLMRDMIYNQHVKHRSILRYYDDPQITIPGVTH